MTPRRLFTLMLAFCAFVLLAPSARAADGDPVRLPAMPTASTLSDRDQKRVDTYYERAATRFEKGDLKGALKAAKQVYALLPNASTALLNAQLLAELNRHCEAFDMSLLAMDLDPTAEEQGDARAGLRTSGARCDRGYGWSRVNVKPVSAAVLIDGVSVPLGRAVGLSGGKHSVDIEAPGYSRLRVAVISRPGEESAAEFELETVQVPDPPPAAAAPQPAHAPVAAAPAKVESSNTWAWMLTGAGVALLAGGGGMHAWALAAKSEADKYREPVGPSLPVPDRDGVAEIDRRERFDAAQTDVNQRRLLAVSLYGLGGAALVGGVVGLLMSDDGSEATGLRLSPMIDPIAPGVWMSTRF